MQKQLFVLLIALGSAVCGFAQQNRDKANLLVQEGIELHDGGQFEAALKKYQRALDLDKYNGFALFEMANTYYALDDYKKALKYLDIIISRKIMDGYSDACYLKGNILDGQGKPEEAIAAYRLGIQNGKPEPMLHFNLAVTLMSQKRNEEAEAELIRTLQLKPEHLSSHYYLGLLEAQKGLKVKALLPLYVFLTFENKGDRAKVAWKTIQELLNTGIEREGQNVTLKLNPAALNDEFKAAEVALLAAPLADSVGGFTALQRMSRTNDRLFSVLSEDTVHPADNFWWNLYGTYFISLLQAGHTEAFTHYIALSGEHRKMATTWITEHETSRKAFVKWNEGYWTKE